MIKKLTVAVACAMAIGFSAYAANQSWFDGGIATGWPTASSMSGGSWSNYTDMASLDSGSLVIEAPDITNPVAFVATSAKTLGTDVQTLTYGFSAELVPFKAVPEVPASSRGGLAVVSNGTEEVFYVLAKDPDAATNVWTATTIPAIYDEVEVSFVVTNCASSGVGTIIYSVTTNDYTQSVAKTVAIGDNKFTTVNFSGDGIVSNLTGQCDNQVSLKIPTYSENVDSFVVSNETTGATVEKGTGDAYWFTINDEAAVWLYAKTGYLFADGKNFKKYAGTMNKDIDLTAKEAEDPTAAKAKIGDDYYLTLQAAADAAAENATVEMIGSQDVSATLMVTNNAITLDLGGNQLQKVAGTGDWIIEATKNLAITNGMVHSEIGKGVLASGAAGLKILAASQVNTTGRAIQLTNDVAAAVGEFLVDAGATVMSTGADAIYSANLNNDDNARTVTIKGTVTAVTANDAIALAGNNALLITSETATLSSAGNVLVLPATGSATIGEGQFTGTISAGLTKFISGGKYSVQPAAAYLADGVQLVYKDDWWVALVPAAKIVKSATTTYYETLNKAFAAAESDDTVTLMKNVQQTSVTVPTGVTLDLNNFAVQADTVVNNGTIVVYDLATATALKDLVGTLKAGKTIGTEADGKIFPINTVVTCTKESVETCTVPKQAITVGDGTLYWGEDINPYQQVTVTGNATFAGNLCAGQGANLVTKLTVTGDLTIKSAVAIGAYAEMAVSGTITKFAGSETITLKAATSKLTNNGALVANTDVVTDIDNYMVVKSDLGVYTVAAAKAKIGTTLYLTLDDALKVGGTVVLLDAGSVETLYVTTTIDLNGFDLTYAGAALTNNLAVIGSTGRFITSGTKSIGADLDLSALIYATQLEGNMGVFAVAAGKTVTLPVAQAAWDVDATCSGLFAGSADGAKLTTTAGSYVWGNGVWTAGTVIGVAKIGNVGYATIRDALVAAVEDDTVTLVTNGTAGTYAVTTKATTIDYNGKTNMIMAGSAALTFKVSAGKTVTIRGGEDLNYNSSKTINIPTNVNFTIENMTYYGTVIPSGVSNAVFTCRNCLFSNKYDNNGSTNWNSGSYASYNLSLNKVMSKTVIVENNEFHTMTRPSLVMTDAGNKLVEKVYVYNNRFIGDKSCQKASDAAKRYPAIFQLYSYPGAVYLENNSISGEYAQGLFSYSVKAGGNCDVICRGNTLDENQRYLWVLHDGGTVTGKIRFGLNTFQGTVDTTQGCYGFETALESNGAYTYTETVASPVGYSSFYAWATGTDSANVYYVTKSGESSGNYVATLSGLADGDTLLVDPETSVASIPEGLAYTNIESSDAEYDNKLSIITKPTAITVTVTIGDNVTSVTYGGTAHTETFTIENVAPSTVLNFTAAFSGYQFVGNVSAKGNLSGGEGATIQDYTFTVDADLTNPNASILFNATVIEAVVYSTTDDSFIARCTSFAEAYAAMTTENQYVRFFKNYIGSDVNEQMGFTVGYPARFDLNGCTVIAKWTWCATVEPGTQYTTYTPYATPAEAFAAKGSTVTYALGGGWDLSTVVLTPQYANRLAFSGILWKGYNYYGSISTNPTCSVCEPTATWGWDATAHTFAYEAVSTAKMKIGDTLYDSISKAALDAEDETIVLTANVSENATSTTENVTLDLNGFKLTQASDKAPVLFVADGSLTITGSDDWGVITGAAQPAISVTNGATVVIDGLYVTNNTGAAILATTGGKAIVSNGLFKANGAITTDDNVATRVSMIGGFFADEGEIGGTNVVFTGTKMTDKAEEVADDHLEADYKTVSFAVPVSTNDISFTYEVMPVVKQSGSEVTEIKVYSVTNEVGEAVAGGVQIPDAWVKTATGKDPATAAADAQTELAKPSKYPGVQKWQAYVLGMDGSDTATENEGPRAQAVQDTSTDTIGFKMWTPAMVKAAESGCKVEYQVEAYTDPAMTQKDDEGGSAKVNYDQNAAVPNPSGVRYYKMKVSITPKQ